MIDCHVHSERSGDAHGSILEICRRAIHNGITDICFTEHIDFEPTDCCFGHFDAALYKQQIDEAQEFFGGQLIIRRGVEVDYQTKYAGQIKDFLEHSDFDLVIGAAHYIDGILLENHQDYFPGKSLQEAYAPYFELALEAVQTSWFDTLAHLDICKRHGVSYFGPFDPKPYSEAIDAVLRAVIEKDLALEVNTSGLR